ncbi:MAG: YceI family protein [Ilumatobacter sp.]|uniref:YceI family protein n=1 Tax=Ilumatobacter sp. TaxID=1967498 RepID=UPI0026248A6F|nr:YceI family protein [Ilumatobacter sp.]MDJ0768496.1 YceI family protein [Ilumatobacter sp.]
MNTHDTTTPDVDPGASPDGGRRGGIPRWLKWGAFSIVGVVALVFGAILIYVNFINDPEDPLDESDLDAALSIDGDEAATDGGATTDDAVADGADDEVTDDPTDTRPEATAPAEDAPASTAPVGTEPPPADTAPAGVPEGVSLWNITDASELGYRVDEVLFGVDTAAVGRTNQITGALTIDGTSVTDAEFVVDVASIESDDGRRDNQFRGRIMSTDEFPTATFTLTEPIELGTEAVEGANVETTATGELTLRGVTNTVTFELTARLENGQIGVLGSIPVLFEDYDIANPSFAGITTEDNGLLEFVLVFAPDSI